MSAFTIALAFQAGVVFLSVVSLTFGICLWRLWREVANHADAIIDHADQIEANHAKIKATRKSVSKCVKRVERLRDKKGRYMSKVKKAA